MILSDNDKRLLDHVKQSGGAVTYAKRLARLLQIAEQGYGLLQNSDLLFGDKVVMDENTRQYTVDASNPQKIKGVVLHTNDASKWLHVKWDNGRTNVYHKTDNDLKLVITCKVGI